MHTGALHGTLYNARHRFPANRIKLLFVYYRKPYEQSFSISIKLRNLKYDVLGHPWMKTDQYMDECTEVKTMLRYDSLYNNPILNTLQIEDSANVFAEFSGSSTNIGRDPLSIDLQKQDLHRRGIVPWTDSVFDEIEFIPLQYAMACLRLTTTVHCDTTTLRMKRPLRWTPHARHRQTNPSAKR